MEKNIFKDRRERLTNVIPNNSALILKGAESKYRNSDTAYAFRPVGGERAAFDPLWRRIS